MEIKNYIHIDFTRGKDIVVPSIQYDSGTRWVMAKLYDNGLPIDLQELKVCIVAVKPDGKEIFNECKIIDAEKGIIEFEITKQMGILVGEVECQIKLFGPDQLLSSNIFKLSVTKTLSPSSESSKDELDVLVNALGQVQDIDNRFAQTNAKIQEVASTGTTVEVIQNKISEMAQDGTITFNTVTPDMTTFLKQTKNLFNKLDVKKGYYWNVATGEQANPDFSYVKIPCEKGKKYIATGTNYNTVFFNSDGTKVGADSNSNGMANCIISTESYSQSAYFIINFRHNKYPLDTYMVVEGDILPSEYIPYGYKFDKTIILDKDNIINVENDDTITSNTVTPDMTTFLKQTKNLFNKLDVKKGYYWNVATGEQANPDFSYVKIPCEKGKKYIATGTNYNTVFFNSDGTKVGADSNSNGMANCIISTESYSQSAYFIINFRHNKYPLDTYMVVEGDILPSEYIPYGYKFDKTIILDKDNIINVKKDGSGDFSTVYDAVKYAEKFANKDNVFNIYIHDTSTNYKGTSFDVLDEMGGQDYLSAIKNTSNNQLGLPLKGYINLIGVGKVKLYAHLPDSCTLAQSTCFSTLDIFGETILENLTIEIKNGRYAVHDESNNKYPNKKHRFKKCKFIHLGNKSGLWSAPHAYASGTSSGCIYEYEDCIFDASASGGYPWDLHNYAPQQGSVISLNGCEMIKSSSQAVSIKLGFNGYSPTTTDAVAYETCFNDVFIKNVITDGTIQVAPEVNTYTCTNNFRLHNFTNITEDIKGDFIKS